MQKVYKEIFPQPARAKITRKVKSRSKKRGSKQMLSSINKSKITPNILTEDEKALFALYPPFIGFQENFLAQFAPKTSLRPIKTENDKAEEALLFSLYPPFIGFEENFLLQFAHQQTPDDGYSSGITTAESTTSDGVLQNDVANSDPKSFAEKCTSTEHDTDPDDINLEFSHSSAGGFKILASKSALPYLKIWDKQIAQSLIVNTRENGDQFVSLTPTSTQMPVNKTNIKIQKPPQTSRGMEFTKEHLVEASSSPPPAELDMNLSTAAAAPEQPPYDFELDKKFDEILQDLGLNDDVDMTTPDNSNFEVGYDMKFDFGAGVNFWKDLLTSDKEFKINSIIRELESVGN